MEVQQTQPACKIYVFSLEKTVDSLLYLVSQGRRGGHRRGGGVDGLLCDGVSDGSEHPALHEALRLAVVDEPAVAVAQGVLLLHHAHQVAGVDADVELRGGNSISVEK